MFLRLLAALMAVLMWPTMADARRVALVVGQSAYIDSEQAVVVPLGALPNAIRDAGRFAELLKRFGFDVISCDGKRAGCFDLDRNTLAQALAELKERAQGADLALVYFAGHGMTTDQGNIVAPVDATIDCETGAIAKGILVEELLHAVESARHKLLFLDACRNNPLPEQCPALSGKKLAFSRIEAGAMQGLLLMTSTQFGQQALDGPIGSHSPFATALYVALEANPGIYFEQVMNEVSRATIAAAEANNGFRQIPGRVVGGVAPADCLAGSNCIGDPRMVALAIEHERTKDENERLRQKLGLFENDPGTRSPAAGKAQQWFRSWLRLPTLIGALATTNTSKSDASSKANTHSNRTVEILLEQGTPDQALALFRGALAIDERQPASDRSVAAKHRIMAALYSDIGEALLESGDVSGAISHFRAGRDIAINVSRQHPDWLLVAQDIAWFDSRLSAIRDK